MFPSAPQNRLRSVSLLIEHGTNVTGNPFSKFKKCYQSDPNFPDYSNTENPSLPEYTYGRKALPTAANAYPRNISQTRVKSMLNAEKNRLPYVRQKFFNSDTPFASVHQRSKWLAPGSTCWQNNFCVDVIVFWYVYRVHGFQKVPRVAVSQFSSIRYESHL